MYKQNVENLEGIKKCFTSLESALSDVLTKEQTRELIESVKSKARSYKLKDAYTHRVADAYNKAVDEVIADQLKKKAFVKIASKYNKPIHDDVYKFISSFKSKRRGLWTFLGGGQNDMAEGRLSLNGHVKASKARIFSNFRAEFRKSGVLDQWRSMSSDTDVGMETFGYDTGNAEAKKMAAAYNKTLDSIYAKLEPLGITKPEFDDWVAKQYHDVRLMKSATGTFSGDIALRAKLFAQEKDFAKVNKMLHEIAFERWKGYVRPMIDEERTFDGVDDEEYFLKSFFDAKVSGVHKLPLKVGSPFLSKSPLIKMFTTERKLHFKDGSSQIKYMKHYGYGSVHDTFMHTIDNSTHSIAVMEKLGTNPEDFLKRLSKKVKEDSRNEKSGENYMRMSKRYIDLELGLNNVSRGLAGKFIMANKALAYAHLGKLGLSSISDFNTMASSLRQFGYSWFESVGTAGKSMITGIKGKELQELGERLGIVSDGSMGNTMDYFGGQTMSKKYFAKYMHVMGTLSGINRLDRSTMFTSGHMIANSLARNLEKSFVDLPPMIKRIYKLYGINKDIYSMMRGARHDGLFFAKNKKFLTRDIYDSIDRGTLKDHLLKTQSTVTNRQIDDYVEKLKQNYDTLINDQVNSAKPIPDKADIAVIGAGSPNNSLTQALWNSVTIFMPYHVSMVRKSLNRMLYSGGAENIFDSLFKTGSRADGTGIMKYMIGSIPLGYAAYTGERLMRGEGMPDLSDPKTWEEVTDLGSTFFLYGALMSRSTDGRSWEGSPIKNVFSAFRAAKNVTEGKSNRNVLASFLTRNNPLNFYFIGDAVNKLINENIRRQS